MEKYLDEKLSPSERAQDLLEKMDLSEKMTQVRGVFALGFPGDNTDGWIEKRGIGQISALSLQMKKINRKDAVNWINGMQEKVIKESPHSIPAVFHMEGICGAYFNGASNYPSGINRGATFDPELEKKIGENVADIELAAGITQILAPVLDIARDPRMGRYGESYGEDPALSAAMGVNFTKGIQEASVCGRKAAATAKHFVGFHSSRGGIHGGGASLGERELKEVYGKSFQASISEAGLKGIMPCYDTIDGNPFSASGKYLTELLRDSMGFDGVTVSDYSAVSQVHDVKKVGETYGKAGLMCMEAGMDVELPLPIGYGDELEEMFRTGKADIKILDKAVLRILIEKFRMGLFENPYGDIDELDEAVRKEGEAQVSRKIAEESIIMLKNDGILPLKKSCKKIAVIGPHAANPRFYFGGYTHLSMMESRMANRNTLAGVNENEDDGEAVTNIKGTSVQDDRNARFDGLLDYIAPGCASFYEEICKRFEGAEVTWNYGYPIIGNDDSGFEEAVSNIKDADIVIMTLGGKYGTGSIATMGEGIDATDINLPECQDEFIKLVKKYNKKMIGIHFDGRPVSSDTADKELNAIIEAFCPAYYTAEIVTGILLGDINPSGKLPVSVVYNAGQIPVVYSHENGSCWHQAFSIGFEDYVDCPHRPRYPFGHGLSYTEYEYSDIRISKEHISPDEEVEIFVDIKNTGKALGTEIVQLYITDEYASVVRPVTELAGFKRVALAPSEKKTVKFVLHPSQMAFPDSDMKWKTEGGRYIVNIGASSADLRLSGSFSVKEDKFINERERRFYCKAVEI